MRAVLFTLGVILAGAIGLVVMALVDRYGPTEKFDDVDDLVEERKRREGR